MILFSLAFGYVLLQIVLSLGKEQDTRYKEQRERERIRRELREELRHAARTIDVR